MVAATMSPTSATALNGRSYVRQDSVYLARLHVESALLSAPPLATLRLVLPSITGPCHWPPTRAPASAKVAASETLVASLCLPWASQAYLPLAHIMELAVEVTCFAVGCRVGYGSPGTITPTALKMLQTNPPQLGDAGLLGPTIFVAAPAVLDKVLIAIKGKFGAAPPFIQKRIDAALKSGYANYDKGGIGAHWSFLIGRLQEGAEAAGRPRRAHAHGLGAARR